MFYRVVQFFRGIMGRITKQDRKLLGEFLSGRELVLFQSMSRGVQVHSLHVAKTLMRWRQENRYGLRELDEARWRILLKGAFLHDIGKSPNLRLSQRVGIVLYHWMKRVFKRDLPFPYRAEYYDNLAHPSRGELIGKEWGLETQILELVKDHHLHETAPPESLSRYIYLADQVN